LDYYPSNTSGPVVFVLGGALSTSKMLNSKMQKTCREMTTRLTGHPWRSGQDVDVRFRRYSGQGGMKLE
jgi:hypothetical protein